MEERTLVGAVGVAGAVSLAVLGIVGRKSYKRKIVQLSRELEKQGPRSVSAPPPKVWAVLTPQETIKVFTIPLVFVLSGTATVGYVLKHWCGIRDIQHGLQTFRWIARVGPPPKVS